MSFQGYRFSSARHRTDRATLGAALTQSWGRTDVGFLPLAAEGKIFLSLSSGSVVALDESTGREIWTLPLPRPYSQIAKKDGACILCSLGILIYFDHELLLVDPDTGTVTARHPVPGLSLAGAAVDGELLLCEFDTGKTAAIHLPSGAVRWQQVVPGSRSIQTSSQGIACVGQLSAIDIASGEIRWSSPLDSVAGIPSIVGDRVLVASEQRAISLDIATGKQVWARELSSPNVFNLSYYPDGKLYVLGYRYLHVLDATTGRIEDECDCADLFKKADAAGPFTDLGMSDEYIYAADFTGRLIALHKTRHTIDFTFQCKSKVGALDAPIVLGSRMYMVDSRGNLYAFGAAG